MADKLESDKGYFFSKRAFLDIFIELTDRNAKVDDEGDEVEPLQMRLPPTLQLIVVGG